MSAEIVEINDDDISLDGSQMIESAMRRVVRPGVEIGIYLEENYLILSLRDEQSIVELLPRVCATARGEDELLPARIQFPVTIPDNFLIKSE